MNRYKVYFSHGPWNAITPRHLATEVVEAHSDMEAMQKVIASCRSVAIMRVDFVEHVVKKGNSMQTFKRILGYSILVGLLAVFLAGITVQGLVIAAISMLIGLFAFFTAWLILS